MPTNKSLSEIYQSLTRPIFKKNTYIKNYQDLFKDIKNPIIVEVGVLGGGSLELWSNYFGPEAKVIGIDLNQAAKETAPLGVDVYQMDQSSIADWESFWNQVKKADILIDDGGHLDHQQITTVMQALPHIADGGLIVVEDTDFSYRAELKNPSKKSFINFVFSAIDAVNSRDSKVKIHLSPQQEMLAKYVESIQIFTTLVIFTVNQKNCEVTYPSVRDVPGHSIPEDFRLHGMASSKIRNLQKQLSESKKYKYLAQYDIVRVLRKIVLIIINRFTRW